MFYSQVILARKGPLGKIWLAAHFEKKLTKSQVFATDISDSVSTILNPTIPLALRVSGHLMLGVVRIYSDKVKYLMTDCRDAMTKIKLAFRSTARVDIEVQAGSKIDDSFFALLPSEIEEENGPELPSTVVKSMVHKAALPRISGMETRFEEAELSSFFTVVDPNLSLEMIRGENLRPSIVPSRTSAPDVRRSVERIPRQEDELPAFDIEMDVDLFDTSKDVFPSPGTQLFEPLPDVVEEDDHEQFDFPSFAAAATVPSKLKRRKVEVDERIELPDKVWKQRIEEVTSILRPDSHVEDLEYSEESKHMEGGRDITENNFFNLTGSLQYSTDLMELASMCVLKQKDFPFALKDLVSREDFEQPEEPELGRDQLPTQMDISKISLDDTKRTPLLQRSEIIEPLPERINHEELRYEDADTGAFYEDEEFKGENELSKVLEQQLKGQAFLDTIPSDEVEHFQSERTNLVLRLINEELSEKESITLADFCSDCSRAIASRFFLELLQLKTWDKIDLQQEGDFQSIIITQPSVNY